MALRVVTYNVHKCRGLDRRTTAIRIAEVLGEIRPDIAALHFLLVVERRHLDRRAAQSHGFEDRERQLFPIGRTTLYNSGRRLSPCAS